MYLNVTGSQPTAAGLSGPRYSPLPTIITPRGVTRGMGVLMLRGRGMGRIGLRGMGALVDDQVAAILQNWMVGLWNVANAQSPDALRQSLISETTNTCKTDFNPQIDCPNGVPTAAIEQAVATYAAALSAAQLNAASVAAVNQPQPQYVPAPPPPPAPAPVVQLSSPAPVAAPIVGYNASLAPLNNPGSLIQFGAPPPVQLSSPAPVAASSFDLSTLTSSLSNQTTIAGFSFPLWGWLAVGGVALYAVTRGKGK